jgi:adenylate cyclase
MLRQKALHDTIELQARRLQSQADELASLNRSLEERVARQVEELDRIGRLRRFLPPQVAELVMAAGDSGSLLKSHRREVTVVFCDLRGFTAFAEMAEPEEVMAVLDEYHACLGDLIGRYEGTLERFMGDGLLVVFNDPISCEDHTERAVRMSLAMRDAIEERAARWQRHGYALGFGIGIARGHATIGRIGFDQRMDYAVIGTVANLAARLCGEAEAGRILISQRALAAIEPRIEYQDIGQMQLKGFHRPVPIFEILRWRD